ncbi:hypothetical protein GCM10027417_24750 [Glutamicibacter endophyticus]
MSDQHLRSPKDHYLSLLGQLGRVPRSVSQLSDPVGTLLFDSADTLVNELERYRDYFDKQDGAASISRGETLDLGAKFQAIAGFFSLLDRDELSDFDTLDELLFRFFDVLRQYMSDDAPESASLIRDLIYSQTRVRQVVTSWPMRQAGVRFRTWENNLNNIQKGLSKAEEDFEKNRDESTKYLEVVRSHADQVTKSSEELRNIGERWRDLDAKLTKDEKRFATLNSNAATSVLTEHFKTFESAHEGSFKNYRRAGITLIATGILFGVFHSVDVFHGFQPWPASAGGLTGDIVWRLVVTSGLVGLGSFFLKQASTHRRLVVWANTIQIQLKTFDAYVGLVEDPAQRSLLHAEFSRRLFGPEPLSESSAPDAAPLSPVTFDTAALADAIAKAIKSDRS